MKILLDFHFLDSLSWILVFGFCIFEPVESNVIITERGCHFMWRFKWGGRTRLRHLATLCDVGAPRGARAQRARAARVGTRAQRAAVP